MKKALLLTFLLSVIAIGCNRGSDQSAGGGTGMQEEQQSNRGDVQSPDSSMGSAPDTNTESSEQ